MRLYDMELANKIPQLVCEREIQYNNSLHTPNEIVNMFNTCFNLKNKCEEHVYLLALDNKLFPLGLFLISKGGLNLSTCGTREIFMRLLAVGAAGFIVVHNHPSGDSLPSKVDIDCFNRLREAGELMGITCHDSIVIGEDFISIAEGVRK